MTTLRSVSHMRRMLLLLGMVRCVTPAHAQERQFDESAEVPRRWVSVVPTIGLVSHGNPLEDVSAIEAFSAGVQIERAGRSEWKPLLGGNVWMHRDACAERILCETSVSTEVGLLRVSAPLDLVRVHSGTIFGVERGKYRNSYLQTRAGLDIGLPRSPAAVRLEARYHSVIRGDSSADRFFMMSTGLRFILPVPKLTRSETVGGGQG